MTDMFYGAIKPIFVRAEDLRKNPTADEKLLCLYLKRKQLGVRFKRQHPIWMYIADFYCHEEKLVIELDGAVHDDKMNAQYDEARTYELARSGIRVIRFRNSENEKNIEKVLNTIQEAIKK